MAATGTTGWLTGRDPVEDPWVERVVQRRTLVHDGIGSYLGRGIAATAVLVVLLFLPGASRWWALALWAPAFVQTSLELLSYYDLTLPGPARWPLIRRWISQTTKDAWEQGVLLNATGQIGGWIAVPAQVAIVAFVLPIDAPTWALVSVWACVLGYGVSGSRAVLRDAPNFRTARTALGTWLKRLGRWLAGPLLSGVALVVLWGVDTLRGPYPAAALPALVVLCLVPLLVNVEMGMTDRTLRAASEEHDFAQRRTRRALARRAAELAGPVAATTLHATADRPELRAATDGLRTLPVQLDTLDEYDPSRPIPGDAVGRAARRLLAGLDLRVRAEPLDSPAQLELVLRILARLSPMLPQAASGTATLDVQLTADPLGIELALPGGLPSAAAVEQALAGLTNLRRIAVIVEADDDATVLRITLDDMRGGAR